MSVFVEPSEYSLALHAGTVIGSNYRIIGVLGRPGGFGITYLAEETRLETPVAIKEYLPADLATRSPDRTTVTVHSGDYSDRYRRGLDQFLQEARTLAKITHPNVVRVRHFFQENETAYLVMDYMEGQTLAELLRARRRLAPEIAVQVIDRALDGLRAAHAQNIFHRDIKPANIYITTAGNPVLLDFGAARQATGQGSASMTAILTPGFAPLEQYGQRGQGPWTDVYAASSVLYLMLTGTEVVPATDRVVGDDPVVPPCELDRAISKPLSDAVMAGLAIYGRNRPQSVEEFQGILDAATGGQPVRAQPVSSAESRQRVEQPAESHADPGPVSPEAANSVGSAARQASSGREAIQPVGESSSSGAAKWVALIGGGVALIAAAIVIITQVGKHTATVPDTTTVTVLTGDTTHVQADSVRRREQEAAERRRQDSIALAKVTDAKKRDSIIKANNAREAAIRAHDDSVAAAERDSARVRTQRLEAARIAAARRDSIVKADLLRQQDSIRRADAAAQQRARDSSRRADSVSREAARQDSIRKAADAAHQAELSVTTAGQRAAQSAADSFIELLRSKGTNTALALGPDVTSILRGNQGVVTQTRTTPSVDGTLAREVFTVTLRMRIEFGKIANTTYTFRALASRSGDQWGNSRIELVK